MAATKSRWEQHKLALKAASAARNWPLAEVELAAMWAEVEARDDVGIRCNTHFTEGVLRDEQGRLDDAETAFMQALALDEKAHGKYGAPDTLHSIGLVRERKGNLEGALEVYRASAELLRVSQPFAFARATSPVVLTLLKLGRHDDALAMLDEADEVVDAQERTPQHDEARLSLLRGEVLRGKKSPEAIQHYGMATTFSRARMPPELAEIVGSAWFGIHRVTSDEVLTALACWYASLLGHAGLRTLATNELRTLPGRKYCHGDPAQPRVALKRPAFVFVASTEIGLEQARVTTAAEAGDEVELSWSEDGEITSLRATHAT